MIGIISICIGCIGIRRRGAIGKISWKLNIVEPSIIKSAAEFSGPLGGSINELDVQEN